VGLNKVDSNNGTQASGGGVNSQGEIRVRSVGRSWEVDGLDVGCKRIGEQEKKRYSFLLTRGGLHLREKGAWSGSLEAGQGS